VWVLTKSLITEEIWPGQGLNPGLPNHTPAIYQLLHELILKKITSVNELITIAVIGVCGSWDRILPEYRVLACLKKLIDHRLASKSVFSTIFTSAKNGNFLEIL
jgi:hypothetical protein